MSPSIDNGVFPRVTNVATGADAPTAGTTQAMAVNPDLSRRTLCEVETEFLIVGAGPAGASLACFLASYGEYRIVERMYWVLTGWRS